jgi:hypothetical protein
VAVPTCSPGGCLRAVPGLRLADDALQHGLSPFKSSADPGPSLRALLPPPARSANFLMHCRIDEPLRRIGRLQPRTFSSTSPVLELLENRLGSTASDCAWPVPRGPRGW